MAGSQAPWAPPLVELAAWPGICSHGSGTSAMVPGGHGCPESMRPVVGEITRWS